MFHSLKTKILVLTTTSMVLAITVSAWHHLATQQTVMADFARQNGQFCAEVIRSSIAAQGSESGRPGLNNVLAGFSRDPALRQAVIFSPAGLILDSTRPEEIGTPIHPEDLQAFQAGNLSRIEARHDGEYQVTLLPIANSADCHLCHGAQEQPPGILAVRLSLADFSSLQQRDRLATMFSSAGILVVLVLTITLFISLYVDQPLRRIVRAMNALERGEFQGALTSIHSSRELSALSSKFNLMVVHLRDLLSKTVHQEREMAVAREKLLHHNEIRDMNITLEDRLKENEALNLVLAERIAEIEEANDKIAGLAEDLEDRNQTLERAVSRLQALHKMGLELISSTDQDQLFELLLESSTDTLRAKTGYILLTGENGPPLTLGASMGLAERFSRGTSFPLESESLSRKVIQEGNPQLISPRLKPGGGRLRNPFGLSCRAMICAPLKIRDDIVGTITVANPRGDATFAEEDLELLCTIASQASIAIKNIRLYQEQEQTYLHTVQALVSAIEASDAYTRGHSERVTRYALRLGDYLALPALTLKRLEQAAVLHDVGKIGICESLLHKTESLSAEEMETLHAHPAIGAKILEPVGFLNGVREVILQHHERFDGRGYPNGLQNKELLLESRILAVADAYDAITTDRPYRRARSHQVALQEILEFSGSQFDPQIAAAFVDMFSRDGEA